MSDPMPNKKKSWSTLNGTADLMSEVEVGSTLVMDLGSHKLRVGYSGQNIPDLYLYSRLAKPINDEPEIGSSKLAKYCGFNIMKDLENKEDSYLLEYPISKMIKFRQNSFMRLEQTNQTTKQFRETDETQKSEDNSLSMNSMISTHEPNTLSGIYEDIEFFIKNILETDMGIELADMDLMLTFNQGLWLTLL